MNRRCVSVGVGILIFIAALAAPRAEAAQIDPALAQFAQGPGNRAIRVIAILKTQSQAQAPRRYDSPRVLAYLRAQSNAALKTLKEFLGTQPTAPRSIRITSSYWINATIAADINVEGLRILARAPNVTKIYANRWVRREPDRVGRRGRRPSPSTDEAELPYQYREMGLDRLIQADPRIDGRGVILGHLDSGVDGTHPALRGKIVRFWDARTKRQGQPVDTEEHGTHTAGSIVGGDRRTSFIGVAPGARLISAAGLGTTDDILAAMQFFLDPDGNPNTNDAPRAINNSWNSDAAPDMEPFYTALGAWEAAGILPVISAGNSGPNPETITHPHEHPAAFAIGATGQDGLVAEFSSRGPGVFRGERINKPDITAPGNEINSSLPNGEFGELSGTSMSTPQVTGATGLLLQLDPRLTPDQLRKILIESATPVSAAGQPQRSRSWNANYGLGKIDIFAAVQLVRRVGDRRRNPRPLGMDIFSDESFLSTPEERQADEILREIPMTVEDLIEYPAAFEGEGWLSPGDIWR